MLGPAPWPWRYINVPLLQCRYLDEEVGLWVLLLASEMVSERKLGCWEIPSEFSQMDPGSLRRHHRKTESSSGPDGMAEKGPWGRPGSSAMGVVVESVKQFSKYLNGLP